MTKKTFGVFAVLLLLLAGVSVVRSQNNGASLVQQSATMLNAATKVTSQNGAVNQSLTTTLTPSGANYVYISWIDLMVCQNATSTVATNVSFTSTNITGSPAWQFSLAATANLCTPTRVITFATPLKSATPGVAVTIVPPTAATNTAYSVNVGWYEAP